MKQPVNDRATCSLPSGLDCPSSMVLESPMNGLSSLHLVGGGPATPNEPFGLFRKTNISLFIYSIPLSLLLCGFFSRIILTRVGIAFRISPPFHGYYQALKK
jgi:hypothetical protein